MLIVAFVRTGKRYSPEYVVKLRNGILRHAPRAPDAFVCITDQPDSIAGVEMLPAPGDMPGWWAKMALFSPAWRADARVVYYDLDTVPCGDQTPLWNVGADFAICENFTRAAGHPTWPCKYGSCVMVLNPGLGDNIWRRGRALYTSADWMADNTKLGDQMLIEACEPNAAFLQQLLPPGFMLGYRDLARHAFHKPSRASLVIFAGSHKPHNCSVPWVKEEWK